MSITMKSIEHGIFQGPLKTTQAKAIHETPGVTQRNYRLDSLLPRL